MKIAEMANSARIQRCRFCNTGGRVLSATEQPIALGNVTPAGRHELDTAFQNRVMGTPVLHSGQSAAL